jgi:hypothetical protein
MKALTYLDGRGYFYMSVLAPLLYSSCYSIPEIFILYFRVVHKCQITHEVVPLVPNHIPSSYRISFIIMIMIIICYR